MIGAVNPVAVYAGEFNPAGSWYRGDVAANCIFEMSDGVVFAYRGSWCAEGCHTSWNGDWRVIGVRGTLLYEHDEPPRGQIVAGDVESATGSHRRLADLEIVDSPVEFDGQRGALREMLRFLDDGTTPHCECHDNIKSLAMVFAATESSGSGKRVEVRI